MKRKTNAAGFLAAVLMALALVFSVPLSLAEGMDAQTARAWLDRFAMALAGFDPVNDPKATTDPARPGEYLYEYGFGTVTSLDTERPTASSIISLDVRTAQVTDCRGVRVGMSMQEALSGAQPGASATQLYVLGMEEDGFSWAYVSGGEVYGAEFIAFEEAGFQLTQFVLTYVITDGAVSAIRMSLSPATQAQADEALKTAQEIASRQEGEMMAAANGEAMFGMQDNQIGGGEALGAEVADLVARLGEPQEIQTLPEGGGRILVYADAVAAIRFDEYTGREIVSGVSVSGSSVYGPRRLTVGMSVQEAAALFRCDQDVYSVGGALYVEGEAFSEPPCGLLKADGTGGMLMQYAACGEDGRVIVLEAGIVDGLVSYWRLYEGGEMEE